MGWLGKASWESLSTCRCTVEGTLGPPCIIPLGQMQLQDQWAPLPSTHPPPGLVGYLPSLSQDSHDSI